MSAPEIPAEIHDRVKRAFEAVSTAALKDAGGDYPAKWRAVAAAKRELADAYEAAYQLEPYGTAAWFAFLDAYSELRKRADEQECEARHYEERRAERQRVAAGGQA